MFPAEFEYHAPSTLDEAFALLARYGEDARVIAGGHSLLPIMKLRLAQPAALIDITHIPSLAGITANGGALAVGATTTHSQVAASPEVQRSAPALAQAAGVIGDPMVRNRGTIGGSLAHADPGADLPAVVLALDAEVVAASSGGARSIPAGSFFTDVFATALRPGEIVTQVRVPVAPPGTGSAYVKFPHPASRYALAGVAARVTLSDGIIASAAVALTGATGPARRLAAVEQALAGRPGEPATLAEAAGRAAEGWQPLSDIHASAEYRQHLARVVAERALATALERARA